MKFTDGNWLLQEGVTLQSPATVYDLEFDEQSLILHAPTRWINHRGATLDGALLTIKLFSPMPDVIGVRIEHHQGIVHKGPEFQLNSTTEHQVKIENNDQYVSFSSGNLKAIVKKGKGWALQFFNGEQLITESGNKAMAYLEVDGEGAYMREQLSLGVGECVYGLGERFTAFVKNGQTVDIWNRDGGTGSEQAYKNVPFYLTNRGYGVFVNHPELVSFEVGTERVSKVQFSVPGEYLEYFIINGPTPKEVLQRYTTLTGKPALPPAWSFGLWLTTSFTTSYDEATVSSFIDGMAERDLPLHIFHFDCFWMKEFHWCNFLWDERVFPDPVNMLKRLKERGLKISIWINPYIAQRSHLFKEGMEKGYFLKRPNGDVWQWDKWQAGMAIVDFTNPEACAWYKAKLRTLLEMGVDSFKTDFGERIPTDVVYYDGSDPDKMHNYYSYLYNKVVFELLEEVKGKGEAVVFARSATAGGQQFPVHWGGDCAATFESMAESLRGGLSLGLSGFGYWSHDIGGFESTATPALYKRWTAFGLLSSHSRLHGNSSYRVPWLFDEEAVEVMRYFTKLKCSLMPYLFQTAIQATDGVPIMRSMNLEFPFDPACDYLDLQYMLGDNLLVAPVFNETGDVYYYLPEGNWTNLLTNQVVSGGRWLKENHDFMSLPLMVRPNSLLAIGSVNDQPEYDYANQVTLHLFQLAENQTATCQVYDPQGQLDLVVTVTDQRGQLLVQVNGSGKPWQLCLRGINQVAKVSIGEILSSELGVIIKPEPNTKQIIIQL
ncbi:MAG: alpha-xylosidase [Firmicutes bacterium]|nr:alpha-xylosidase [Bacillota bacterium]